MALEVIDCEEEYYPYDGDSNGYIFWALLSDETGKETEFELFYGYHYSQSEEYMYLGRGSKKIYRWIYICVWINGKVDYEDDFNDDEWDVAEEVLRKRYPDIFNAIDECYDDKFEFSDLGD
jgi:hypothetical protein